jgi:hypothetical protein
MAETQLIIGLIQVGTFVKVHRPAPRDRFNGRSGEVIQVNHDVGCAPVYHVQFIKPGEDEGPVRMFWPEEISEVLFT